MYQRGKKLLSMLLALCMIVSLVPLTAQAALLNGEDYITQQLYLGEDLVLHLRGDIPESYRSATAVITFCGESKSCAIGDLTQDENGLYDMAVEVDVAEMTENIGLKATYLGLTAIEENYSVAQYLKTLVSGNYTNQTKLLALELLNYGTAAQNFFDYNTDNLANAGGYEYAPANAVPEEAPTVWQSGRVDGIKFYAASVRFLSKTAVRFYFAADSVDGLTFTVDGTQYTPDSNENGYFIEVGGINPQDMDDEMTVEVTDGTDTLSVKYAPIYYFIRTYHNTEDEELKNLAAAAYSYFVAANNFVGVEPTGDFVEGISFDEPGNVQLFSGVGGDNAWRDALLEIVSLEDNNVLKMTCASSQWPVFRINFGKTLEAGTVLAFDAYSTDLSDESRTTVSIFEYVSGGEATAQYYYNSWNRLKITLTSDCDHIDLMCNMDRWNEPGPANLVVYLDNFKAIQPVEPSGDIFMGFDFEEAGHAARFTGIGVEQDADIEITSFADSNVLKLSHSSHYYPTFQMNFGQTLKAGTTITFDVWGTFNGWQSGNDMNIEFTGDSGSGQVVYMVPETWFTATITLTEDRDHLQFFWNIERGNGISGDVASCIRIDNVLAVEPPAEPSGDILAGIDFETEGNELRFTGIGYSQDATVERVTYSDAGVAAGENGGSYAAKLSNNSHYYPTFQMNFGQTLKAGTTITFDVWGTFDGWQSGNDMNIEFTGDSGSGQVVYMVPETWFTATITLTEDRDHLQFFWNIERGNGISGDVASYILIDNVKATEPDNTFYNGLTFDNSTDVNYFGTVSGQEWRSPALEIVSFDGDNALKITCAASQWPALRINFGRTLPTGTQITFQAYTNDTTGIRTTVSIFEAMANCTETAQYYHGSWTNLVTTLTADCSYIDLCVNFDRWNEITPSNIEVYIDNVIVQQGFTAGADFEMPYDVRFFTGAANGNEWRDATAQIVSKDGRNVLMMTGANSLWPTFKIDFGETLKAGTTISFDVLGVIDYEQEGMSMTFNPIDGNVVTDEYGQAVWMLCDEWNNKTITLSADCSSISFYWDAGRNNLPDGIVSYVYIDNVVVNAA